MQWSGGREDGRWSGIHSSVDVAMSCVIPDGPTGCVPSPGMYVLRIVSSFWILLSKLVHHC
jgi:hypothetical protein